eukprot:scaffold10383_cov117-Isochrysis_galbana.AAC.6
MAVSCSHRTSGRRIDAPRKDLWRERRDLGVRNSPGARVQGVPDGHLAWREGDADYIARIGPSVERGSVGTQHSLGLCDGQLLPAQARVLDLEALLEPARADAHVGNPVAVLGVGVGLQERRLEDEAGEVSAGRLDHLLVARQLARGEVGPVPRVERARHWGRAKLHERVQ